MVITCLFARRSADLAYNLETPISYTQESRPEHTIYNNLVL